ncbi:MAG: diguanylate cyclase, partial [Rhizobacter sp.]
LARLAEQLRRDLVSTPVLLADGRGVTVSASFGALLGHRGDRWTAMIERADAALYEAKRGGRDRVVIAQGSVGSN